MSEHFEVTAVNRVRQQRERGAYDRATVFDILDRGLVAHVAFIEADRPVVIPMAYGRDDERFFFHGSRGARIMRSASGVPVSIAVTLLDGLVVARSMFDCSMNYRAVVLHGRAVALEAADDRWHGLRCIAEHNLPGWWSEARAPSESELRATVILAVPFAVVSVKVRHGPPSTDDASGDRIWSGVLPIHTTFGLPIPDASVPGDVDVPASITTIREQKLADPPTLGRAGNHALRSRGAHRSPEATVVARPP